MAALETALQLAAQGYPVFPCGRNKRPAISEDDGGHGFHDATADESQVRELFGRAPHATLVGSPTGEKTGFDVLDVDPRNGGEMWEHENLHRLPETRIHQTPGGGRHYLFRHAHGVRNSSGHLKKDGSVGGIALGVDVRGDGGYVILPPCAGYEVVHEADIAEWPDWLLDIILREPEPQRPKLNGHHHPIEIESRRLDGFVRSISDRVSRAPEGAKHFTLRNAALSLGGIMDAAGLSEEAATQLLLNALPATVKDWKNAAKTIAWGLTHGRNRPIELEERHAYQAPVREDDDPGWWHSLEASLTDGPTSAETSAEPPQPVDEEEIIGRVIDPTKDWLAPAPLREWVVDGWIPRGYVTGLYADGGTGKSLIVQQLLTSVATSLPWLGLQVRGGRAFGLMCEDDNKELHRRQEAINAAYGLKMAHLENLRIAPRLGFDNLMMVFDQQGRPQLTELFADFCRYLDKFPPMLVALDTVTDIFGGNELNRSHARLFVQGVGGQIARRWNCGVIMLAHPSAAGLASKSGTSGSTAWNNTFRSRIYMARPENDEDGDTRLISRMKANYAPKNAELTVEWTNGAFGLPAPKQKVAKGLAWEQIDAMFAELDRAWKAGEAWSNEPQTAQHGRYFPLWADVHLGVPKKIAGEHVGRWLASGHLRSEYLNNRTKSRGLRVVKRLRQEGQQS